MGRATDLSRRKKIVDQKLAGQTLKAISEQMNLPFSTVRRIWRRYRDRGPKGLAADYTSCGQHFDLSNDLVYRSACYLKFLHPMWGAPLIRILLEKRYTCRGLSIPSSRSLQRWFKQKGYNKPRSKAPKEPAIKASAVLQVWQIDAKEHVQIASGQRICWLTVTDEHSCGLLGARAFPPQADLSSASHTSASLLKSMLYQMGKA